VSGRREPRACTILSYKGHRDGIRYGEVSFSPGGTRHFLLDRINGHVRLWKGIRSGLDKPDHDRPRILAALKAFMLHEPFP
jgi:hypothetical protein